MSKLPPNYVLRQQALSLEEYNERILIPKVLAYFGQEAVDEFHKLNSNPGVPIMHKPHVQAIYSGLAVEGGRPMLNLQVRWDDHCQHDITVAARSDHTFDKDKIANALETLAKALRAHE